MFRHARLQERCWLQAANQVLGILKLSTSLPGEVCPQRLSWHLLKEMRGQSDQTFGPLRLRESLASASAMLKRPLSSTFASISGRDSQDGSNHDLRTDSVRA